MRKRQIIAASVIGTFLFAPLSVTARSAEPVAIHQAYVAVVSNFASILLEKRDLMRHYGKSYVMTPVHFRGSPAVITALASGEIEIGHLAYSSFAVAVENAKMDDLRVISGEFEDGVPGYYSNEYFLLKDSPIRTIEDLKGKVLATNGAGSAVDIPLRAMLRKHGLDPNKDVTMVQAALPNMLPMLQEHKADLFANVLPFSADPVARAATRVLFTQADAVGRTQMNVWVARKEFIDKHRAALVDYMEDALRVERWYLDPKNREAAIDIAVKASKKPRSKYEGWLFTHKDYYHDLDGLPDLKALQASIALLHELGFLKASLNVQKYADLSIVKEAARRLD
jgi:NitT/TauT family transport system substrate-binding protein